MADDGDAGRDNAPDLVGLFDAAFEFDAVTACLSYEAAGVADGGFNRWLVEHVRHVTDQEGGRCAAADRLGVADHIIHSNGQGGVVAEHGHAQAVAHQNHLDTCLLLQICRGVVVAGQPGDGTPVSDLLEQIR